MNNLGFARVATAIPKVKPADIKFNVNSIKNEIEKAENQSADFIVFPELSITGYTCADLFYQSLLLNDALEALPEIANAANTDIVITVGLPIVDNNKIYNAAAVICNKKIWGIVPKTYLPNYNEFYEKRWFTPAPSSPTTINSHIETPLGSAPLGNNLIFEKCGIKFAIEICEDLWVPTPPSCKLSMAGADIIFNLSATNEQAGKHDYLRSLIAQQSARCRSAYVYTSAGLGESSTDLVFSGNQIIAENGRILSVSERFKLNHNPLLQDIDIELLRNDRVKFSSFSDAMTNEERERFKFIDISVNHKKRLDFNPDNIIRYISAHPFTDGDPQAFRSRCDEIISMQAWGLMQRLQAIGCKRVVLGISGGLDSTLALLVCAKAYDMLEISHDNIITVTMPGFGTTGRTYANALKLMKLLNTSILEIPIGEAVRQHFHDIDHSEEVHDAVYENGQARERTQILMDLANKYGGIVIGTGDLSELALGWCTYNGDQMSMYGVNASIPKTLVRHLVKVFAENCNHNELESTLLDIIDTPISPELLPADNNDNIEQKTEDLVGPYELHDFFLYNMMRNAFSPRKIFYLSQIAFNGKYDASTISYWLKIFYRRFFGQQFKRSAMPDGMKVGSVSLSPRGDWRMPSDASVNLWLSEIDNL